MDLSGQLSSFRSEMASRNADLSADIQRLQEAKNNIITERDMGLQELKQLTEPELGALWKGTRAEAFDEDRATSSEKLNQIFTNDFEGYISSIESKISQLQMQMAALATLGSMANEVGDLISRGEDALDAAQDKLSALGRRLTSWL